MNKLIPPIVIDKNKITRWHPEFDVESVIDISPSSLPKIEIDKPKIATAKDILGMFLFKCFFLFKNIPFSNFLQIDLMHYLSTTIV